jgi:hypothetical protein
MKTCFNFVKLITYATIFEGKPVRQENKGRCKKCNIIVLQKFCENAIECNLYNNL